MKNKLIDGRALASKILGQVSLGGAEIKKAGWSPKLVSIKVGNNPAVDLYVRNQKRQAKKAGIEFVEKHFDDDVSEAEMYAVINNLNVDPGVTGIIIQRPIPEYVSIKLLQETIHPLKDVEGLHPASIGNIVYKDLSLGPCTAMAAVALLRQTGVSLKGLEVTVIGHSEIVGKPIAFLLMAEGATVTVCHHMTRQLAVHSRRADAVFVAVGKANLITAQMLKPGAIVIDIGINQIDGENGEVKVVGDCDFDSCIDTADWITPVPGGVGPVTVSILMQNTLVAAKRLMKQYEKQFSNPLIV
jgi:methylenetetrahydrofolate dehydrogenase (NADP+)/methenyltetrahydrofolate cyclohydrolase